MSITDIEEQCQTLVQSIKKWDSDDLTEEDFVSGVRTIASAAHKVVNLSEDYIDERPENDFLNELVELAYELRDMAAIFIKRKKEAFTMAEDVTKQLFMKARTELLTVLKSVFQICRKLGAEEETKGKSVLVVIQEEQDAVPDKAMQKELERKARVEERQGEISRQQQHVVKIVTQAKKFLMEMNELQNVVINQDTVSFKTIIRKVVSELDKLREYGDEVISYAGWEEVRDITRKNISLGALALKNQDDTIKSFLEQKEKLAEKIVQIVAKIRSLLQSRISEIEQESLDDQEEVEEYSHDTVDPPLDTLNPQNPSDTSQSPLLDQSKEEPTNEPEESEESLPNPILEESSPNPILETNTTSLPEKSLVESNTEEKPTPPQNFLPHTSSDIDLAVSEVTPIRLSWSGESEDSQTKESPQNKIHSLPGSPLPSVTLESQELPSAGTQSSLSLGGVSLPFLKKEGIELSLGLKNIAHIVTPNDSGLLPELRRQHTDPELGTNQPPAAGTTIPKDTLAVSEEPPAGTKDTQSPIYLPGDTLERIKGKGKRNTGKRVPRGTRSQDPQNHTDVVPLLTDVLELSTKPADKILEILFGKFSQLREEWDRLEETERNNLMKAITSVISDELAAKDSTQRSSSPSVTTKQISQKSIASPPPRPASIFMNPQPALPGLTRKPPALSPSAASEPKAGSLLSSQDSELGTDAMSELQRLMEMSIGDLNQVKKRLGEPGKFSFRAKKADRKRLDRRSSAMMDFSSQDSPSVYPVRTIKETSLSFISTTYQMIALFESVHRQRDLKWVDPTHKDLQASLHVPKTSYRESKVTSLTASNNPEEKIFSQRLVVRDNFRKVARTFLDTLTLIQNECPDTPPENSHGPIANMLYKQMEEVDNNSANEKKLALPVDNDLIHVGRWLRVVQQSLLIGIHQCVTSFYFTISQILTNWNQLSSASHSCTLHVLALINSVIKIMRSFLSNTETLFDLEVINTTEQNHTFPKEEKKGKEKKITSPMWDPQKEKEAEEQLGQVDSPGDLDNLVLRLTPNFPHTPNHDYTLAFLTTCQRFCKPGDILDRLFDRFNLPNKGKKHQKSTSPSTKTEDDNYNMARVRVTNTVLKWLKSNSHYVDEGVATQIRQFIDKNLRKEKIFDGQIKSLEAELNNTSQYELPPTLVRKAPDKFMAFGELYAPFDTVYQVDELIIAQQLTLIEFEIYSRIKETELLGQAWSKEKRQFISQNVVQLILRTNRTSFWVATCILLQPKVKDRAKVLTRFMNIAKHLRDLNNYNTLMGIVAGLNTVSVSRLRHTFTNIKKNVMEQWDQLMELMNPSNSFKRLRTAMDESGPTALPYLGMYLSDLTFMEDGNADEVVREVIKDDTPTQVKMINFSKHFMIYRTIDHLRKYQTCSKYLLQRQDPVFTFLFELPTLSDEDLYQLSLTREPRDSTVAMIK